MSIVLRSLFLEKGTKLARLKTGDEGAEEGVQALLKLRVLKQNKEDWDNSLRS